MRIETRGQELAVIGAGEIFGEMAMIDRVQRSAADLALTGLRLVPVDSGTFLRWSTACRFFFAQSCSVSSRRESAP